MPTDRSAAGGVTGLSTPSARPAALPETDVALLRLALELQERGYRFTTVTPATHARVNARPASESARTIEDVFGWSRPFRETLLPAPLFALMRAADVAVPGGDGWRSAVRFSTIGEQLFVHSAYPTSSADAVFFGPDTYRFVAAVSRHLAARHEPIGRAVDIGCGAGPGAIAIALDRADADVIAVDISAAALRLTNINAALAGTRNLRTCQSDLLASVDGAFDLIVANPPYLLDATQRAYRHGGGDLGEGLSLAIAQAAVERLAPGGTLLLYTGVAIIAGVDRFRHAAATRLDRAAIEWSYEEIDPDVFGEELLEPAYSQADRIAAVLLTAIKAP